MEFDKNDMVIIQEIKKVIKHEENHDRLLEPPPIIRKMNIIYEPLVEFVFEYAKTHKYISKVMCAGLFVDKTNPIVNLSKSEHKRKVKREVSLILDNWSKLGLCEKYGQNTVKINREKLKKFGLEAISKAILAY